jgi:hypothetical protein
MASNNTRPGLLREGDVRLASDRRAGPAAGPSQPVAEVPPGRCVRQAASSSLSTADLVSLRVAHLSGGLGFPPRRGKRNRSRLGQRRDPAGRACGDKEGGRGTLRRSCFHARAGAARECRD